MGFPPMCDIESRSSLKIRAKLDAYSLRWLDTRCCSFARWEDQDVGTERNIVEHAVPHGHGSQGIAVSARDFDCHHIANFDGTIQPLANTGSSLVCLKVPNPSGSSLDPFLACLLWRVLTITIIVAR
ncbi:Hypothetical predicted protein [Olea europaea subsp. europaea]|uniref:Uncharacterized protein n=1 Tax=Olea europaea subsp. europaea TaxID=158383 RepID=A0A8S0SWE7_OLEEU|nr:Hypothetical predicted protein [Olea europaea subsp. europaea]